MNFITYIHIVKIIITSYTLIVNKSGEFLFKVNECLFIIYTLHFAKVVYNAIWGIIQSLIEILITIK